MRRILKATVIAVSLLMTMIIFVPMLESLSFGFQLRGQANVGSSSQNSEGLVISQPKDSPAEFRLRRERELRAAQSFPKLPTPFSFFEVVPNPESRGKNRDAHALIAGLISQQAQQAHFVPEARLTHFSWLNRDQLASILGWKGTITGLSETTEGLRVRVKVDPVFPGNFVTNVFTMETYYISNEIVRFSDVDPFDWSAPRILTRP